MKRVMIIILIWSMLIACVPTPDEPIVMQKDTDRLVDTVLHQDNQQTAQPATAARYTYEYKSENGRLTIHVDADVSTPVAGSLPMARVKMTGHTDEQIKKLFDYVFAGETAYLYNPNAYTQSKQDIANEIAYYQELVDTGHTDDKLLTEEEALEYIEELKEQFKKAPDESSVADPIVADGTLQFREIESDYGKMNYYDMQADAGDTTMVASRLEFPNGIVAQGGLHFKSGGYISWAESAEGRIFGESNTQSYVVSTDDTTCAYGQTFSPADAVKTCMDCMRSMDVTDVAPHRFCDVFITNGKTCYLIDFVRTVNGNHVAHVPSFQMYFGTDGYEYPWLFERICFLVDESGIRNFSWDDPVTVQQVLSENVQTISFDQAKDIFENMCCIVYEAQTTAIDETPVFFDLYADYVELSLIRIREQNADMHTGLYVPAWIFYGKCIKQYQQHEDINPEPYLDSILFVINAIDGSIIDIEKGY